MFVLMCVCIACSEVFVISIMLMILFSISLTHISFTPLSVSTQARLMKISPNGLYKELPIPNNSPQALVRNESLTSSLYQEENADYFNSNIPLTRMRPALRKVDSTKTFDTVSSLGSSDAVDQVSLLDVV
jgi:hypothetical protein